MSSRVETLSFEQAESLHHLLTADDQQFINTLRSERRRREVMGWRSLLRHTLMQMGRAEDARAAIEYSPIGAPYLVGSKLFISTSHTTDMVAVMVSDLRCAIDIELLDRDFTRAASRYCSDAECALLEREGVDPRLLLPLVWCAKETLYKISGRTALDLLADLRILSVSVSERTLRGVICGSQEVDLKYERMDNHLVVMSCVKRLHLQYE